MVRSIYISLIFILCACNSKFDRSKGYVPQSSGNLNNITVVMPTIDWNGKLGQKVRDEIEVHLQANLHKPIQFHL